MLHNIRLTALFTIFLFSTSKPASANKGDNNDPHLSRTIILNQVCQHVEVWGNVEIVLSPAHSDRIVLQGTTKDVNGIATRLKNGKLSVHAGKVQQGSPTKIILPAAMLRFIRINGDVMVTSADKLKVPQLKVELNGEAQVRIQSSGYVSVSVVEGYELVTQ